MGIGTIESWDFGSKHVQNDINPGKFVGSKTVLIAFGPPQAKQMLSGQSEINKPITLYPNESGSNMPIPVGLVQAMTLDQAKQIDKIFEIGSERSYQVVGRTIQSCGFSKIMYLGPSLLKFASSFYLAKDPTTGELLDPDPEKPKTIDRNNQEEPAELKFDGANRPGFGDLYLNFASELFNLPIGVLIYMRSNSKEDYGAVYLENGQISNSGLRLDVGAAVLGENISVEFDGVVPIKVHND
jgi:hypothetical protein